MLAVILAAVVVLAVVDPWVLLGGVEAEEEGPGHVAQNDGLDGPGDLVAAVTPVVNVQSHDGQGAGERHEADGDSVVQS